MSLLKIRMETYSPRPVTRQVECDKTKRAALNKTEEKCSLMKTLWHPSEAETFITMNEHF